MHALTRRLRNQKGFTLLELLVVVAILAAVAGTATIALQDTDARASAAAHVAMMDELNKGIGTYRVLQRNQYPNNFDSLLSTTDPAAPTAANTELLPNADGEVLAIEDVAVGAMIANVPARMAAIGMTQLRFIDAGAAGAELPEGVTSCAPDTLQAQIGNRGNNLVAGNIFNGVAGNGCGASVAVSAAPELAYYTGDVERVLGPGAYGDAAVSINGTGAVEMGGTVPAAGVQAPVLMAVGVGPASSLFTANQLGSMTSVPVYRHVQPNQYNRFIALFQVATATSTGAAWGAPEAVDQITFAGIVDGAGDTKEEELGEWDGTRNTI